MNTSNSDGPLPTAGDELDRLRRIMKDLAEKQMEHGLAIAFAVILGSRRDAKVIMTEDYEPVSSRSELAAFWSHELTQVVGSESRGAGYCVSLRLPGENQLGVLVHLEHVEGSSEDVLYRCRKDAQSGKMLLEEPVSRLVPRHIFATPRVP